MALRKGPKRRRKRGLGRPLQTPTPPPVAIETVPLRAPDSLSTISMDAPPPSRARAAKWSAAAALLIGAAIAILAYTLRTVVKSHALGFDRWPSIAARVISIATPQKAVYPERAAVAA